MSRDRLPEKIEHWYQEPFIVIIVVLTILALAGLL